MSKVTATPTCKVRNTLCEGGAQTSSLNEVILIIRTLFLGWFYTNPIGNEAYNMTVTLLLKTILYDNS